jgi:hypothetical protein
MGTQGHGDKETGRHGHGDMDLEIFFRLPFAHHENGSSSFVHLMTKKQWKFTFCKRTKRTKWTCPSMGTIFGWHWYKNIVIELA